jgi:excisionase family DNA binding protein
MAETLLTVKDVAKRLAVGRTTVYELISRGGLKTIKIGRARRIPESALDEWIGHHLDQDTRETESGMDGLPHSPHR